MPRAVSFSTNIMTTKSDDKYSEHRPQSTSAIAPRIRVPILRDRTSLATPPVCIQLGGVMWRHIRSELTNPPNDKFAKRSAYFDAQTTTNTLGYLLPCERTINQMYSQPNNNTEDSAIKQHKWDFPVSRFQRQPPANDAFALSSALDRSHAVILLLARHAYSIQSATHHFV